MTKRVVEFSDEELAQLSALFAHTALMAVAVRHTLAIERMNAEQQGRRADVERVKTKEAECAYMEEVKCYFHLKILGGDRTQYSVTSREMPTEPQATPVSRAPGRALVPQEGPPPALPGRHRSRFGAGAWMEAIKLLTK